MVTNGIASREQGDGDPEIFDTEWREALTSGDPRWLSYPTAHPRTQAELFERVKANQVDRVLDRQAIRRGRVLEYACGSAGISVYLANRGFTAVAADLSIHALQLARRNAAARSAPGSRFTTAVADVFRLPFRDGTFDVVMSYGLLEHFTEDTLVDLLKETNRVLRPGGLHIVDIIHGRFSIRTLATGLNFLASSCLQLAHGRASRLPALYRSYFQRYYENRLVPKDWSRLFRESGLRRVAAQTCRPFPALAISNGPDRCYTAILKGLLPLWRRFDDTDLPGVNWLGWMYLVYGVKPLDERQ